MIAKELEEIIENAGYETRRYSGRFMYGKECVAFEVPQEEEFGAIAEIIYSYVDANFADTDKFWEGLQSLNRIIESMKLDEMGRDNYILYFPQVKYE